MAADPRMNALGVLIDLERMARRAEDPAALRYVMVNETGALVPCRQAAYWDAGTGLVAALSGMSLPDRNAPFVGWLLRLMDELHRMAASGGAGEGYLAKAVTAADVPGPLRVDWAAWLPASVLSVPVGGPDGVLLGILVLARAAPFLDHEVSLAGVLSEAYGHAMHALLPKSKREWSVAYVRVRVREALKNRRRVQWVTGGVLLVLLLPVRISSLAPAEVSARDPWVVRSPLDGVVRQIDVPPNMLVKEGRRIVSLERSSLENTLAVTRQSRMVAEAEYRRAAQQAVYARENMSEMSILQAKAGRLRAEEEYAADQLARTVITAEREGVAVYGDPDDWNGRPVKTGERILSLMDPKRAKLDIWLGVDDAIALEPGSEVVFFLSSNPLSPVHARLRYASYAPEVRPDGTLAYNLEARFTDQDRLPRVGLKGTAKIFGRRVPMVYYLLRRPLAAVRRWTGL